MRWPGAELCWPLSETGIQSVAAVSIRLYGVMVSVCGVSWDWQRWARPGSSSSCHRTSTVQHSVLPAQYRYPALTTSHHLYSLKKPRNHILTTANTLADWHRSPHHRPSSIFPTHHPHSCWISILRVAECCSQLKIRFIKSQTYIYIHVKGTLYIKL